MSLQGLALLGLLLYCCCYCYAIDAPRAVRRRGRALPELEVHKNASAVPAPEVQTSILNSMQAAQDSFIFKLAAKYGRQYTSTLFHDAFYELSDNGAAVQQRFLQRLVHQRNFTMGFTGISNSAGHDNLVSKVQHFTHLSYRSVLCSICSRTAFMSIRFT
jgi:hypothetical protein